MLTELAAHKPGQITIGTADDRLINWKYTTTSPNLLIEGRSGSGKTALAHKIAGEALLNNQQLILLDGRTNMPNYQNWALGKAVMTTDADGVEDVLAILDRTLTQRTNLFRKYNGMKLSELPEEVRPVRTVVIFDNFDAYLSQLKVPSAIREAEPLERRQRNKSIFRSLERLFRLSLAARAAGFSIVLIAQRITLPDFQSLPSGQVFWGSAGHIIIDGMTPDGIISGSNASAARKLQEAFKPVEHARNGVFETADGILTPIRFDWIDPEKIGRIISVLGADE